MEVTIIGTGKMGRAIGTRLVDGGHEVRILGTTREKSEALASELGGSAQAVDSVQGDVAVLAVQYVSAKDVVQQYADGLAGKTVIDITNPLTPDYSELRDTPAGSGAQEIAAALPPGANVVKAFNTTFGNTVPEGRVAGEPLDVFVAADDEGAKQKVIELIESSGLRALDAGPLARAHQLEELAFLHIAMQGTLGTGFASSLKVLS